MNINVMEENNLFSKFQYTKINTNKNSSSKVYPVKYLPAYC